MTTPERNKIAGIIKIYCQEQRLIDKATAAMKKEASLHGMASTQRTVRRYCRAQEYVHKVDAAWQKLTISEQRALEEFYGRQKRHSGACVRIQDELELSERQVYRLVSQGLEHLQADMETQGIFEEVLSNEH